MASRVVKAATWVFAFAALAAVGVVGLRLMTAPTPADPSPGESPRVAEVMAILEPITGVLDALALDLSHFPSEPAELIGCHEDSGDVFDPVVSKTWSVGRSAVPAAMQAISAELAESGWSGAQRTRFESDTYPGVSLVLFRAAPRGGEVFVVGSHGSRVCDAKVGVRGGT